MDVAEITDQLGRVRADAEAQLPKADTRDVVETLRVQFLGKKGQLTAVLRGMGKLSAEDRPSVGQMANEVRDHIASLLEAGLERISTTERTAELAGRIDVSLPGRRHRRASKHPLTTTSNDILTVLSSLGFQLAEGPEIEHDFYNFEALNIPHDHPARDMQDTFYIADDVVLRTHTSPVQIRAMLAFGEPPVRVASFGRVFRKDDDPTHSPMFHQVEGLYVDTDVTFGDLKGTLELFSSRIFKAGIPVRLRPSFFPFTEPSAEVDIGCFLCDGEGEHAGATCRVCKGTGWVEIMGAGMVDPAVFEAVGFDPDKYSGFAFGVGVERVAMLRYGVSDIRTLYENDQRFLRQFF